MGNVRRLHHTVTFESLFYFLSSHFSRISWNWSIWLHLYSTDELSVTNVHCELWLCVLENSGPVWCFAFPQWTYDAASWPSETYQEALSQTAGLWKCEVETEKCSRCRPSENGLYGLFISVCILTDCIAHCRFISIYKFIIAIRVQDSEEKLWIEMNNGWVEILNRCLQCVWKIHLLFPWLWCWY